MSRMAVFIYDTKRKHKTVYKNTGHVIISFIDKEHDQMQSISPVISRLMFYWQMLLFSDIFHLELSMFSFVKSIH